MRLIDGMRVWKECIRQEHNYMRSQNVKTGRSLIMWWTINSIRKEKYCRFIIPRYELKAIKKGRTPYRGDEMAGGVSRSRIFL